MKIMKKIIKKIFEKIQNWIFFSVWFLLVLGVTYAYTSITNVSNWDTLTHTKFNQIIAWVNDAGTFRDTVDNRTCEHWIKSISNNGTVTCKDYDTCGGLVSAGGYTYTTKRWMDGKCWTSTNMKHIPSSWSSWCYDGNAGNCNSDWRLYDWTAATHSSVCWALWTWWSLPTDAQWTSLENSWASWWNWNKLWGLAYVLPGIRTTTGSFYNRTSRVYYWSSTEDDTNTAWSRYLRLNYYIILSFAYNKNDGFSVLCIKN